MEDIKTIVEEDMKEVVQEGEYSVWKALRNKTTFINFVAVLICFGVVSFNYYMIGFYMKYVGGNIFINTIASTVSECIGNFAAALLQKYIGTRRSFVVCFGLALAFAAPLIFTNNTILIAVCVFSSKFFVEAAFMLAYFVNSEVFPPLFVPFSFSVCNLFSRIITIAAPQIAEIKPTNVPVMIFCAMSFVATAGALILRKPTAK